MPSKQQNTKPSLAAIHHAHTISRATNLHYLQDKQLYNNNYQNNNNNNYKSAHQYLPQQQIYYQTPMNSLQQQQHQASKQQQHQQLIKNLNGPALSPSSYHTSHYEPAAAAAHLFNVPAPPPLSSLAYDLGTTAASSGTLTARGGGSIMMHKQLHDQLLATTIERPTSMGLNRPLCRCRVMYLGSSVPHITKNGLHGIQEPLRHLYPEEQFSGRSGVGAGSGGSSSDSTSGEKLSSASTALAAAVATQSNTIDISHLSSGLGIDSWLSVWSNGLLLENFDEFGREVKRFFSIESLHYCAAVRFFDTKTLMTPGQRLAEAAAAASGSAQADAAATGNGDQNNNIIIPEDGSMPAQQQQQQPPPPQPSGRPSSKSSARFLPLDAPLFQCPGMVDANHPPVFAAIMRRTTGIKVLECHAFICRRDAASNALVRCCTQAYADLLAARRLSFELSRNASLYQEYPTAAPQQQQERRRYSRSQSGRRGGSSINGQQNGSQRGLAVWSPYESVTVEASVNRRLPSLLIGATGAQVADGSNEDNNSNENSSEDNYAIISKHHYQHRSSGNPHPHLQDADLGDVGHPTDTVAAQVLATSDCVTPTATTTTTSRASRGAKTKIDKQRAAASVGTGRKQQTRTGKAGSSKSLFTDFMPKTHTVIEPETSSSRRSSRRQSRGWDKLSHSMDMLELNGTSTCCSDPSADQDSIKYSVVGKQHGYHSTGGSSKRHSRSMQNLDGPLEFSAAAAEHAAETGSQRSRQRRCGRGSERSAYAGDRRSASYHDVSEGEPLHRMSGGAGSRLNSRGGSELTIHQQPDSCSASQLSLVADSTHQRHSSPPPLPVPPANSRVASGRHISADAEDAESQTGSRIYGELRSSGRRRQKAGGSHAEGGRRANRYQQGSVSSSRRRERSAHRSTDHLANNSNHNNNNNLDLANNHRISQHYPYHLPVAPSPYMGALPPPPPPQSYHHYPPPPMAMAGAVPPGLFLPYYLPQAAYHHHAHQAQFPMAHYPHPQVAAALYGNPQHFAPSPYRGDPSALLAEPQARSGHSSGGRKSAHGGKSAAKALASGFRCLSPPMNFLSSMKRQSTASSTAAAATPSSNAGESRRKALPAASGPVEMGEAAEPHDRRAESQDRASGSQHTISPIQGDPTAVVSGQPGFLLSSGAGTTRAKRMGWIKRLSLTMSGSPCPAPDPMDPSTEPVVEGQRRKRRSSLFSGSLTIGRRRNRHQQPQQQQQPTEIPQQNPQKEPQNGSDNMAAA